MANPEERGSARSLSFNGDLISFRLTCRTAAGSDGPRRAELRYRWMRFQKDAVDFAVQKEGMALIGQSSLPQLEIVDCGTALDVRSGQTAPCVLLQQRKRKAAIFKYILLLLSGRNSLEPHLEFKLPYEIRGGVTFLLGPTVLWSHEGTVFYTSLQASEVRQVPVRLSSVSFIGELPVDKIKILVLGSQNSTTDQPEGELDVVWGHRSLGYFVEDGRLFDGAWILPHAYSSVVTRVCVISAEEADSGLKSTVVAASSADQLVRFESGLPRDVCQLPFKEPERILPVNTGRDGHLFIICFSHGNVCAVWKDSFQVASSWQGVCSVHVDDFVGCGTEQVLFLFGDGDPPGGVLTDFLITDLCSTTYTSRQMDGEEKNTAGIVQENQLLTIQALESRLLSGRTLLQDLQRDGEVKDRVLLQSIHALADVFLGREHGLSRADQEGLVSLWDEDEEAGHPSEDGPRTAPALPSPVERIWQRIIEDCLIVGVVLTAAASLSVESVSVSFLTEARQGLLPPVLQTHSTTFRGLNYPPPRPHPPEPAAKRIREDQTQGTDGSLSPPRLTATAITDVTPLLASAGIECHVMVHVTYKEGAAASCRPGGPVVAQCAQVSLDIQDVARGKFCPQLLNNCQLFSDQSEEDLLSLLAVSKSWAFRVHSPDHTLCDVPQWLLGAVQCQRVAVCPDYLLASPTGPSAAMLFRWKEKTPFLGELTVHCRSQALLLQFLDSLCGFLPPSCEIQPLGGSETGKAMWALASCLEAEALTLQGGIRSLLRGAGGREEKPGGAPEPAFSDPTEALQRCRQELERDRERSRGMMCPLVDVEQYRRLTAAVAQVQLEGDIAAQTLWEALPASCPE